MLLIPEFVEEEAGGLRYKRPYLKKKKKRPTTK